jgi:hypothetical protein
MKKCENTEREIEFTWITGRLQMAPPDTLPPKGLL